MRKVKVPLSLLCFFAVLSSVYGRLGNRTTEFRSIAGEVYDQLIFRASYNPNIRPVQDDSQAVDVLVYLELLSIHYLDEKSETFKATVYMHLRWTDEFIQWNQTIHDVTSLTFSQSEIWTPELVLTNSFERYQRLGDENLKLMVTPDGTVSWETIEVVTSTCQLDTTFFPFDSQTCDINFVVWNYFREDVRLVRYLGDQDTGLHEFESHPSWEMKSLEGTVAKLRKSSIRYSVTLQRKARYYVLNFVLPTVMLTILNVMTFMLPHDCGERASYSITVFLSMVVMLTILSSILPESSNYTCIFGLYLIIETGLSTLMTIINIVLVRVANFTDDTRIAPCLRSFVRFCCRRSNAVSSVECEKDCQSIISERFEVRLEWVEVVRALDKLCFYCFFTISALVTFTMLYVCVERASATSST